MATFSSLQQGMSKKTTQLLPITTSPIKIKTTAIVTTRTTLIITTPPPITKAIKTTTLIIKITLMVIFESFLNKFLIS